MKTTRRGFVGTIALGAAAGALTGTSPFSKRASAQTREAAKSGIHDGGVIQLNQNESARGPGPKTIQAIQAHTNKRMGRGYSPDHVNELRTVIADYYEVGTDNVQLATGSTPLLQGSVRAFCSATKGGVPRRRPGLSLQSEQPHRHRTRTRSRRAFRAPRAA